MQEVQAVILNIAFPKSLEEVLSIQKNYGYFDIESLMIDSEEGKFESWTVPKWCKIGDIIFYMHSKSSKGTIARLKASLKGNPGDFSIDDSSLLMPALERGVTLYEKYGGKIFAIGRVSGAPYYDSIPEEMIHWKSKIYADVSDYFFLETPIDLSEFSNFIQISSRSAITPVFGKEFDTLKSLILRKNSTPDYFKESVSTPLPLSKVNQENWLQIVTKFRRSFFLEAQFRTYYVDFLLSCIGDRKTFFKECTCIKRGKNKSFVDNVILIGGRYLPVEVKLRVGAEKDLIGQLRKYCGLDSLMLDAKKHRMAVHDRVVQHIVLVIDTNGVYWYHNDAKDVQQICLLDNITTHQDIQNLREQIITIMDIHDPFASGS